MCRLNETAVVALGVCTLSTAAWAQDWLDLENETGTRLVNGSFLGAVNHAFDTEEKDYASADVDQDGDVDLIVMRKEPFTTTGRRTNALLMNEGFADGHAIDGLLVDRTDVYAASSDVPDDHGFLTETNDRDVVLVDVNNDGWLDMVTAPALGDYLPKHISHPRVYINLGETGGVWQGFEHQDARIPLLYPPNPDAAPRYCSVTAGDVTGDGFADLYFGDYDNGAPQLHDFDNNLLINDGDGYFTDESQSRLTFEMRSTAFGGSSFIADFNGDNVMDVMKQSAQNDPYHVAITYNNPNNPGFFNYYDVLFSLAPYFANVADLNNDGRMDIVITDDSADRFLLNIGNDAGGHADFSEHSFPNSEGFGGNSLIANLDNDYYDFPDNTQPINDVIITDVDVDVPGCGRTTHIYRNVVEQFGVPTFHEQTVPIPAAMLTGVHDVAALDINRDGWLDLVMGRCTGTQVWMNQPPSGLLFNYLGGLPTYVDPSEPFDIAVKVVPIGATEPATDTGKLFLSTDGGPFVEVDMVYSVDDDGYTATLPAADCLTGFDFYFTSEDASGVTYRDPQNAPVTTYSATVAYGTESVLRDEMEEVSGLWTVESDPSLTGGEWVQVDPDGTLFAGDAAQPEDDATQGIENVMAFVTGNDPDPAAGTADVDGGPTRLVSPMMSMDGADGVISYARWFYSEGGFDSTDDVLSVDISNDDGASWTPVPEHTTGGTNGSWQTVSFKVSDYVTPTATVQVRFTTSDNPNDSVTEAGIDNFQFDVVLCDDGACLGDANGDDVIDVLDLLDTILNWGPCVACPADGNGDSVVDVVDLVNVILGWGPCP